MIKKCLRDFELGELEALLKARKIQGFRAKQIFSWIHKGIVNYDEMTNISKQIRSELSEEFTISNMDIVEVLKSKFDGTKKYLMELSDGNIIECVFMKYKHGNTICISSQVGCKMGCSFCASTIHGMTRNLTAGEMIGQILEVSRDCNERISNVVLMGSGEPLDNLKEVLKFLRIINHSQGLNVGMRSITISTCGIIPKIEELMNEKLQITLAVSLHAVDDEIRDKLMPVNKKYPIKALLNVCRKYIRTTGRRITFEYALIKGENDTREVAERLAFLLKGMNCHVNLIPINPVVEKLFVPTTSEKAKQFKEILIRNNIEATIRRELGSDIDAACGQLRNKHIKKGMKY